MAGTSRDLLAWQVMEGMETLEEINSQFCDDQGRPYRDIRILHTYVLDDPFDDPPQVRSAKTERFHFYVIQLIRATV